MKTMQLINAKENKIRKAHWCDTCGNKFYNTHRRSKNCPKHSGKPGCSNMHLGYVRDSRNTQPVKISGKVRYVDGRMVNILKLINSSTEWETLGSCSGHGRYPPTIIARKKGTTEPLVELISGIEIKTRVKYYRKSISYYYIPEILELLQRSKKKKLK